MSSEPVPYQTPPAYKRIYVSWHEQWTLQRYVDHYLTERNIALTDEMRRAVVRRVGQFPGKGALKKSDMDFYLDANARDFEKRGPKSA